VTCGRNPIREQGNLAAYLRTIRLPEGEKFWSGARRILQDPPSRTDGCCLSKRRNSSVPPPFMQRLVEIDKRILTKPRARHGIGRTAIGDRITARYGRQTDPYSFTSRHAALTSNCLRRTGKKRTIRGTPSRGMWMSYDKDWLKDWLNEHGLAFVKFH
jgi:hypothetical protein